MKLHDARSRLLSYRHDQRRHLQTNPVHQFVLILSLAILPLSSLLGGITYLIACFWPLATVAKPGQETPSAKTWHPVGIYGLLGFVLLSLLPLLTSVQPLWHLTGWLSHYGLPAVLIYGQVSGIRSGRFQFTDILTGLLAGSALLACVGVLNYWLHWQTHMQLLCSDAYGGFCLMDLLLLAEDRARSFSMHPNVLGALMSLAIPLWLCAWHQAQSSKARWESALGLLLIITALLVTYSRTAWISGLFSLGFGLFWLKKGMDSGLRRNDNVGIQNDNESGQNDSEKETEKRLSGSDDSERKLQESGSNDSLTQENAYAALKPNQFKQASLPVITTKEISIRRVNFRLMPFIVVLMSVLLMLTQFQTFYSRWQALWQGGSTLTRWQLWQAGWHMLKDHLCFGTGILQVEPLLKNYLPVIAGGAGHLHNWYLQVAVESGLPAALCLFITIVSLLIHLCFHNPNILGKMAALMLWSTVIASCFDITLLDFRVLFVLCWACSLLWRNSENHARI